MRDKPTGGATTSDGTGALTGGHDRAAGRLAPRREIDELGEQERHILECLGAAVVNVWGALPRSTQRAIFEYAAAEQVFDPTELRRQIARFLHEHND
jgi:hypothetical protein